MAEFDEMDYLYCAVNKKDEQTVEILDQLVPEKTMGITHI